MKDPDSLGSPSLKIAGLQVWIHGRQFPESHDFWDGNWLSVTVHCGAKSASVWAQGAILMVSDLRRWADECELLRETLSGTAALRPLEPGLSIVINSADNIGHLNMQVLITPDHMTQRHSFDFDIDQTYLSDLIRDCRAIVKQYPVRGSEPT
jgi:hypothetical protein